MTIVVLGKGDRIAFSALSHRESVLGSAIGYSHPTSDVLYSKYGFSIPVDYEAVPLELVMKDEFLHSDKPPAKPRSFEYVMVKPEGSVWFHRAMRQEDHSFSHEQQYVYTNQDSWWVYTGEIPINDYEMILGLLINNPTEEMINQHLFTWKFGTNLEWKNISDIVADIDKRYNTPAEVSTPKEGN